MARAVPETTPSWPRPDTARASGHPRFAGSDGARAPELVAAVKSGVISINAAAAVASLPAEEQKSAALGGKDELKQAAKRVRDVHRKTPKDAKPSGESDSAEGTPTDLQALQERVAALTSENQALRAQVAQLQAQLSA